MLYLTVLGMIFSSAHGLESQERTSFTLDELRQPVTWPQPQTRSVTARDAGMVAFRGNRDETAMRKTLPQLYGLSQKASLDLRPYFEVKLANVYADLDEDPAAYQSVNHFLDKKGKRPCQGGIDGFPQTCDGLRRLAHLLKARILARNGLTEACGQVLSNCQPRTGYEELLFAEICALLGHENAAQTHLTQAMSKPDGHPESNWGTTLIPLRAISLARSIGLDSLVITWGAPLVQKGRDAEKRPQWNSSWAIMDKIVRYTRDGVQADWQTLKDGTYTGTCLGFEGEILVSLTVANGRLDALTLSNETESRPFSALTVIPRRIKGHQSLTVDVVTGATATSCAIITAAEEALIKASK